MRPWGREVEGEIVGRPPPMAKRPGSFFHPLSGAIILGVDWLAFGADLFSGFAALAVVSAAAFAVTFWGVASVQRRLSGDPPAPACWKAFLGAVAAGLPFPITGTVVGALILALCGR